MSKRSNNPASPIETAAHADERRIIAEAVAQGCAAHAVLREEAQREREAAAAVAYARTYKPTPRLKAAPAEVPTVELPAILASAGVEWQRGNTLALDLADWILRMEQGWSYAVGADLWVWITLREGDRFTTDVERVEHLLGTLTDSTPQQVGKNYVQVPRGGKAVATGRAAREGLTYGADSALAWGAASPWHYVMRSRRCQAFVGDDLIGYALTIAPTTAVDQSKPRGPRRGLPASCSGG